MLYSVHVVFISGYTACLIMTFKTCYCISYASTQYLPQSRIIKLAVYKQHKSQFSAKDLYAASHQQISQNTNINPRLNAQSEFNLYDSKTTISQNQELNKIRSTIAGEQSKIHSNPYGNLCTLQPPDTRASRTAMKHTKSKHSFC